MSLMPRRPSASQLDPWKRLVDLEHEMDRLFDWTLGRRRGEDASEGISWMPAIDLRETEDAFVVEADLPGLEKDDIEISVLDNVLTIKGETKMEEEVKEEAYHRMERVRGKFQRSISMPSSIDQGKVKASFKNGVLQMTLPKHEEAKPKQIKVDVEG